MPKRVPTPPPGDDEPRYLTVVHPYAISGTCNMELPKDREDFARWVACCVDKDAIFAIFHKPSSRDMVIIEVNREYAQIDRILGEHRWSEFLVSPSKEEKGRVSRVFYCTYNTGRIVQKNGWKRIDVEEAWFTGWSPRNRCIKYPYPEPHFCDVPVEDQTNHSICRPLPVAVKSPLPEVIAAPQPVVGSAQWIQKKEVGMPATATTMPKKVKGAWGKGAPKAQVTSVQPIPTANGRAKAINTHQEHPVGTRLPAVGGGPVVVKANNVWKNTTNQRPAIPPLPVALNLDDVGSVFGRNTPASRKISPAPAPPGLLDQATACTRPAHQPGPTVSREASASTSSSSARAANSSAASWVSNNVSTSSPDSEWGPDLTTATESDDPYKFHVNFPESMEDDFHGLKLGDMEEDDLAGLDAIAPATWDGPIGADTWDNTQETWDNVEGDAELEWSKKREAEKPTLCSVHGVICKKGICAEYAKQLRMKKKEEERQKFAANRGKKGARGKGRGAAKPAKERETNEKTTLQPNAFRGPGAPVKTNWRGAPRAIVSADAIEKREGTKTASSDASDSDSDNEPNAAAVVANVTSDNASSASWNISENSYDPWSTPVAPPVKANQGGTKPKVQAQKKPMKMKGSSSWADQVEQEMNNREANGFSTISSKSGRGPKGSKSSSTTSLGAAKLSTSG